MLKNIFYFVLLSLFSSSIAHAYLQEDTAEYVSDFAELIQKSYAQVDHDAPAGLATCINQGKKTQLRQVTVQGSGTLSAAQVQSQCSDTDQCIIENGITLEMNSSLHVHSLLVRDGGNVIWNDSTQTTADQWLCVGFAVVETGGSWDMNLQNPDKNAWIYIMNNGAVHPMLRTRSFGSSGIMHGDAAAQPQLKVIGRELTRTWSLLAEPLTIGSTTLKLMHDPIEMGWQLNDRIAVAPTKERSEGSAEEFFITDMSADGTLTLSTAATALHKSNLSMSETGEAALYTAEVINLSRNIIITGDDFEEVACDANLTEAAPGFGTSTQGCMCTDNRQSCTVGLNTAAAHGSQAEIANIRVEKCGQRGIEGKYCMHFHHMMDCPDCVYRNNAIENSQQRGLIVHSTHHSTVEANVLYGVRGASIYVEDGNEVNNTIKYNVGICPWPTADGGCSVPGTSNGQGDTSLNQSGIYMESPSSHMIGNRMANHFNGMFNQAGAGRGPVQNMVCGSNIPLGIWDGNTFHSSGRFGTYLLNSNYPRRDTGHSTATNGKTNDCDAYETDGSDKGLPNIIMNHFDYGNAFVGQYNAGDVQYFHHTSINNLNGIYWKETKTFEDGCSAHISDAYYKDIHFALPDAMGAFIIEDTIVSNVDFGPNHHCKVGITGILCMPQYVLHNVKWLNGKNQYLDFTANNDANIGGLFTLSPDNAAKNTAGNTEHYFLPAEYNSLVSARFSYLLDLPGDDCVTAASLGMATKYNNGILCKSILSPLKVFSHDLANGTSETLNLVIKDANTGAQLASYAIPHMYITEKKQGYGIPVIPGNQYRYELTRSNGEDIPQDWIIDFGDLTTANRWGVETLLIDVQGRSCNGSITSNHDRRFYMASDFLESDFAGWGHGACSAYPTMPSSNCEAQQDLTTQAIETYTDWHQEQTDMCEDAGITCGDNGACAARYLGSSLGVLPTYSCICKEGFEGSACQSQIIGYVSSDDNNGQGPTLDNPQVESVAAASLAEGEIAPIRVKASSLQGNDMKAAYTVDHDLNTRWASQFNNDEWIYYDFGEEYSFNSISIVWEAAHADSYSIQTSNNAETWTTVKTIVNSQGGSENLSLTTGTKGRFLRVRGISRSTVYGYSIYETTFFGELATQDDEPTLPYCDEL